MIIDISQKPNIRQLDIQLFMKYSNEVMYAGLKAPKNTREQIYKCNDIINIAIHRNIIIANIVDYLESVNQNISDCNLKDFQIWFCKKQDILKKQIAKNSK